MSTLTFSPVVTNSGTWISAPVSSVAGLVPPVERSPCRPGSVWEMTYLYREGDEFVFMDTESFDQINIPAQTVGTAADYMLENTNATVALHESNPLYVELPASVELEISYTEPGLQGDRSSGGTKPATLETGAAIQVPLFLTTGEKVKVDTRDGRYLGRVSS